MLSCILFALGSFDTEAQKEVQRLLGCPIELSKMSGMKLFVWMFI